MTLSDYKLQARPYTRAAVWLGLCDPSLAVFVFQAIVAGQGLNDDMWHTLKFSRKANSIKFQVDDEAPIKGNYRSISYTDFNMSLACRYTFREILFEK